MAFFISEIDKFLQTFDQKNPQKSVSQLADIKKHARIFKARDSVQEIRLKNSAHDLG